MAFSILKRRGDAVLPDGRPEPLMHVAARANSALRRFDSDLRASGFGTSARGLARDLYVSFVATARAVKGTEDEIMAWAIIRALALDLNQAGFRQGALNLLDGVIEVGVKHAPPQILQKLRATSEAVAALGAGRTAQPKRVPDPANANKAVADKTGRARFWAKRPEETGAINEGVETKPLPQGNAQPAVAEPPNRPAGAPDDMRPPRSLKDIFQQTIQAAGIQPADQSIENKETQSGPPVTPGRLDNKTPEAGRETTTPGMEASPYGSVPVAEQSRIQPAFPKDSEAAEPDKPVALVAQVSATELPVAKTPLASPAADHSLSVVHTREAKALPSQQAGGEAPALCSEAVTPQPAAESADELASVAEAEGGEAPSEPPPVWPQEFVQPESWIIDELAASENAADEAPRPPGTTSDPEMPREPGPDSTPRSQPPRPESAFAPETEIQAAKQDDDAVGKVAERPLLDNALARSEQSEESKEEPIGAQQSSTNESGNEATEDLALRAVATRPAAAIGSLNGNTEQIENLPKQVVKFAANLLFGGLMVRPHRQQGGNKSPEGNAFRPAPTPEASAAAEKDDATSRNEARDELAPAQVSLDEISDSSGGDADRRLLPDADGEVERAQPETPAEPLSAPTQSSEAEEWPIALSPSSDAPVEAVEERAPGTVVPFDGAQELPDSTIESGLSAADHLGRREPTLLLNVENFVPAELEVEAREYLQLAPGRKRRMREVLLGCITIGIVFIVWSHFVDTKGVWRYAEATWVKLSNTVVAIVKSDVAMSPAPPATATPAVYTPSGSASNFLEELPVAGHGLILSTNEVRYCVFQGRRLSYMREHVKDDEAVRHFNGLVADFNARCSNFRFLDNALNTTTREANAQQASLEAQAIRMMADWPTTPYRVLVDLTNPDGASQVQAKLKSLGFFNYTVDGVWGSKSADALSKFRKQNSLGDGPTWDLATQGALLAQ